MYEGFRAAGRYAKALLEHSLQSHSLEKVFQDMQLIHKTIEEHKDLNRLLASPVVKVSVKRNVLNKVFTNLSTETQHLFKLLEQNKRLPIINLVAQKFIAYYNEHKNNKTAYVTTAVPLTDQLKTQVLQKVGELTGNANIELKNKIDPNIIGGFILRVGDAQYNASVAHKLATIERNFKENLFV
ncbi:ATP synthase F1 subunit delta [Capnocytophaga sp.]|uniref:ATP synthase F1 subunit delta n=1 Tax=Capnocytophaga sp. TaxID=44737 RepID=UPI0026DD414C|nr:ATP synthase F1 subunit delta [Capnocytophaga sp.]MDO5105799.1 ATP synthase F1 subunit delta [Capnocytophaga sp.]